MYACLNQTALVSPSSLAQSIRSSHIFLPSSPRPPLPPETNQLRQVQVEFADLPPQQAFQRPLKPGQQRVVGQQQRLLRPTGDVIQPTGDVIRRRAGPRGGGGGGGGGSSPVAARDGRAGAVPVWGRGSVSGEERERGRELPSNSSGVQLISASYDINNWRRFGIRMLCET